MPRCLCGRDLELAGRAERLHRGHLDGGRRREPGADRDIALHQHVHAPQPVAGLQEARGDAAHVVAPALLTRRGDRRQIEGRLPAQIQRVQPDMSVVARRNEHARLARDGRRQHKALIVIGVLADQVDPTRSMRQDGRRPAKDFPKTGLKLLGSKQCGHFTPDSDSGLPVPNVASRQPPRPVCRAGAPRASRSRP